MVPSSASGLRWPSHDSEDRPIRSLVAALSLTLILPVGVAAQGDGDPADWPSADELRRDLQDIGYEFAFDGSGRLQRPTFQAQLPVLWTLTSPAVAGDELPDGTGLEPFRLQLIDDGSGAVRLLFAGASSDEGEGEYEPIATMLMEVGSRLPADNGMDAVVWFLGRKWQSGSGDAPPLTAPCYYEERGTSVTLAWFGGEGEEVTSFLGTVGPEAVLPDELELCKRALAEAAAQPEPDPAAETEAGETDGEATDYSVPPEEAAALIEAGDHIVIDVRTPAEYEAAHVVGAINIDVESPDFAERIAELDPEGSYLVYCRTGRRSDLAAQQMAAAGFSDVVDAAGLADLARAGVPIE